MFTYAVFYLVLEWAIRIGMLFYVPQRKTPAAARTWLLFVFFLPIFGFLLYLAFGRIYLPKKRTQLLERVSNRIRRATQQWKLKQAALGPVVAADIDHAAKLVLSLGEFPVIGGNAIELIDDYDAGIARLIHDIDQARNHVHLLYYIMGDDAVSRQVADALARAVKRGVTCRVLLDYLGSRAAIHSLGPALKASGVELSAMLPVGLLRTRTARFDLRNHRKIAVIDGAIGYIGSQNIVAADFRSGVVYEDLVARVKGPVVAELQVTFLADRYHEVESPISDVGLFPEIPAAGDVSAQLLPSGPGYENGGIHHLIVALIHGARKRVVMTTPYFIPDEPLLHAMEIAVLRGVRVHLIVSKQREQFLVAFAQQSFYEQLLERGVRIHLYRPKFLHAKHMTVDDAIAVIGSSNVDIRSFALNSEVNLVIYDADIVTRQREIEKRYFANSHELTLEEWSRRSVARQAFQSVCRLIDSFL